MPAIPMYEQRVGTPRENPRTDVYQAPEIVDTSVGFRNLVAVAGEVVQDENRRRDEDALAAYDQQLAELDFQAKVGDENNPGADRLLGVNAAGSTKRLLAAWDKGAEPPKLSTPEGQRAATRVRSLRRHDLTEHLTDHEYRQGEFASEQQAMASLQTYAGEVGMAGNEKDREVALTRLRDTAARYVTRKGLPAEAAARYIGEQESKALTGVAENLMSTDPLAAQAFIDNEPRILFEDRSKLNQALAPFVVDAKGDDVADDILAHGEGALVGATTPEAKTAVPNNVAAIQSDYRTLANTYGARISSMTRTPDEQAKLVARGKTKAVHSQHVTGTACDFVVPPDQAEAFMADCRRRGYQVIDERKSGGTGPHIHVELPPGGARASSPPTSRAQALDAAAHIADKRLRAAVTTKLHQRFAIADAQRQETERATMESVYTKVWDARDSGKSLRSVLTPAEYTYVVANNHAGSLSNVLTPNQASNISSLDQKGQIQQQFYLAATGDKKAMNFVNAFNPWDVSKWQLTNDERNTLANQRLQLSKHDPQTVADITSTGKVVEETMFNTFGYTAHPSGSDADEHFDEFQGQLTAAIQQFKAANKGAMPNQQQVQQMADVLVLQTANGKRYFEAGHGDVVVPEDFAAKLRAEDKTVTDAEIRRVYMLAKATGRL